MAFANASVGILVTSSYSPMFTTANGGQTWTPQGGTTPDGMSSIAVGSRGIVMRREP